MTHKSDVSHTELLRAAAQARGLERAYALFPDTVAAAHARGNASLSPFAAEFSSVTEPALTFDPTAAEGPR